MRSRALSLFVLSCLAGTSTGAFAQALNPSDSWDVRPLNLRMRAPGALDHIRCGKQCIGARLLAAGLNPDGSPMFAPTGQGGGAGGDDGMSTREASTATDFLSTKLEIEFVPSSGTNNVIGTNTMKVKSLVNGLTQFTFRLRSQYTISVLTVDGVAATASTPGANSYGRTITLPRAYNAGEIMTIVIGYNGLAASRGFGSIEFTTLGGNSAIFTLSEPYYAATWWPLKDGDVFQPGDNSDKFTAEIWVTVPTAMTVASNGVLQGIDTLSGSRRRHRWQTNYQTAPYLIAIGAATYNTWTKNYLPASGGSMPVQFFLHPGSDNASQRADWEKCIPMMETFRTMGGMGGYGMYPFINEKYGLYQFTFGGGMEHQTMTGQFALISESLTAHELGHQWWGDNVTCKTWNNIWLNEGFATYSECLWEEFKAGSSGFPALQSAINARSPGASAGAVYKSDITDPNTIFDSTTSYDKGAWVLHMLRHAVGSDATFWQILQTYRATYEGSGATTDDFFNVVNSVTGKDFTAFRDKWVYGTGSPTYSYGWQTALINGQNYLKLRIDQTGAFGFFNTPIDVRVNYSGGSSTQLMENTADPQWYLIPIPAAATSVTLDPNGWVLNGGKTSVAYVAGPPRVIATSPAIGATTAPGAAPTEATVNFSDNVTSVASDYTVTKDGSPVAFTMSYNAATFKTTLDFGGTLDPGVYTVTAKSTIVAAGGSGALDGEIGGATLPSGNGVAGGNAVFTFTVDGCPSDFNGDGFVDAIDYDGFITAWLANDPAADYNGDEFVDAIDYDGFITAWLNNC